jgi:polysaccharide deacetylase 2 family uncharacterized protein YibQ
MASPNRYTPKKKSSGARIAALVIVMLILAAVAGYLYRSLSGKTAVPPEKPGHAGVKPKSPPVFTPQTTVVPPPAPPQPHITIPEAYPPGIPVPPPEKPDAGEGRLSGRLAIVIDDMGGSLTEAKKLASINVPLTFAIIPGLRFDMQVAAYAAERKIETMIHIPMQSKGWPARRLEENGLLVSMTADELQERVAGFVQKFPGAVGVNNHMGSEFTGHEDKMGAVLQVLKKHDLFFIDSVTSPESTGWRVAQRLGIRSARRNVFLDNEQERGYILGQLNQAVRMARKSGAAIAICHPHPATIATLAAALPGLERQGVQLVPASELVR